MPPPPSNSISLHYWIYSCFVLPEQLLLPRLKRLRLESWGGWPLFAEIPRVCLLGNCFSALRSSRELGGTKRPGSNSPGPLHLAVTSSTRALSYWRFTSSRKSLRFLPTAPRSRPPSRPQ